jgi:uncharacterized protein YaeQ
VAINSTVHKVELSVADLDRHAYSDHALTIARHPSETEERMMVRVLAFALYAHERLEFGRGIGEADDPDLWRRDLTGRVELWIEVGLPDERRVRKACGVADRVVVLAYGGRGAELWWGKAASELKRCRNLDVVALPLSTTAALATMAAPRMELQYMVQDGETWLSGGDARIAIERTWWMGGPGPD